jgi:hypothetical protein
MHKFISSYCFDQVNLVIENIEISVEYTISAATLAALPDPIYSCEYNCKQYGEDAVKPRAELGVPSLLFLCIDCFMFTTLFITDQLPLLC